MGDLGGKTPGKKECNRIEGMTESLGKNKDVLIANNTQKNGTDEPVCRAEIETQM